MSLTHRTLATRAALLIVSMAGSLTLPVSAQRKNLGDSVNSQWNEIIPVISADGHTLYFDRKNYPLNTGGDADYDDIWYSELRTDGTWTKARNLAALNTR